MRSPAAAACCSTASIAPHFPIASAPGCGATQIGFVYQFHNLLPEFSAVENVMMPQLLAGVRKRDAKARAMELLANFGLDERASHRPAELSGGEQQRVAIARAVANSPCVLLADEPTGNLDPHTAGRVFEELIYFIKASGVAALMATHNFDLAARMDRMLATRRRPAGRGDAWPFPACVHSAIALRVRLGLARLG